METNDQRGWQWQDDAACLGMDPELFFAGCDGTGNQLLAMYQRCEK